MITFDIIKDLDQIKEYYAEWERIFDSGSYEASLSIEWTEALRKTHVGKAKFFLMVLRDSAGVLGLVPLCMKEVKRHGLSLSTLFPLPEYFNTHSDLLFKNGSKELVDIFLRALSDLEFKWDIFRINRFIEDSPVLSCIADILEDTLAWNYEINRAEPSFFIKLDTDYNDFLKSKSANFRHKLKSVSKKLRAMGDISFSSERDFRDFDELYDIILSIEENSWKHPHGTAITSTDRQRSFYRELFGGAFEKRWLRLCLLYLKKEPIAFDVGLAKDKKYYCVHTSYDEKFREGNPGTVLLARFIEDLIVDGVKEYDWFGEPFEWESRWTDKFRWHKSLLIYNNTPKAKLFRAYNRLRNEIRGPAKDQLILRNPRDIRPSSE